jgi:hypothetical protein
MTVSRLEAQAVLQSGDGKGSFFNERAGSAFLINFSDKSAEFDHTYEPTAKSRRFGGRLKVIATDGFAELFEPGTGKTHVGGEVGGYAGYYWQTSGTQQFGFLDFRTWLDLSYSQASYSLAAGGSGGAITRMDTVFRGFQAKLAANSFLGRVLWMDVSGGASASLGNRNNYDDATTVQFCQRIATQSASGGDLSLNSCKDAKRIEEYRTGQSRSFTGDLILWQPWLQNEVGVGGGIDVLARYDSFKTKDRASYGLAMFVSPKGKPQVPYGALTLEWRGDTFKVGFQSGITF